MKRPLYHLLEIKIDGIEHIMDKYKELKEEAYLANLEIPKQGLAIYTWGNVSAFDPNLGVFAIKPSGVSYDKLQVDDMVIVDLNGDKVEGKLNPSSDTQTHLELYKNFDSIGGICHTHSPYATAWAQAMKSIPLLGTTHADHLANPIICTKPLSKEQVENGYEKNTGILIYETFNNPTLGQEILNVGPYPKSPLIAKENPMVLVGGHGPFSWGKDALSSVYNARVLEEVAKMAMWVNNLNPNFNQLPQHIIKKHYERKHGKNAYYGQ
jgi:L-ribulose-5-phosphate 4-epimerase